MNLRKDHYHISLKQREFAIISLSNSQIRTVLSCVPRTISKSSDCEILFGGCRQRHSLNFFTPLTRQRMWREFQSLITNLWTNLATKWFYPRTETWKPAEIIKRENTFSNGCLGSHNDEERSEMRYVMRIAKSSESSKLWTHLALPLGVCLLECLFIPTSKPASVGLLCDDCWVLV